MSLSAARTTGSTQPIALPTESHATASGERAARRGLVVAVAALVVIGTLLRVLAARGDLWLDEVWSLHLVAPLTAPDQVFWAISHDNNHFLNSLWIYALGQEASPLLYRLPSIGLGALSIVVAAYIGRRTHPAAAVLAGLLLAVSYAGVDYGSEARGYGALIPAMLLAIALIPWLIQPADHDGRPGWRCSPARAPRWVLALTIAVGACAHLTMVIGATILALSFFWMLSRGRSVPRTLDAMVALFWPTVLLLLPLAVAIATGVIVNGGFALGGASPFTLHRFIEGYGGLLGVVLGLPAIVPPWVALVMATALLAGLSATGLIAPQTRVLAAVALLLVPTLIAVARPANVEFPRYFLTSGLVLVVAVAEAAGRSWARGGVFRASAMLLVGAICLGQGPRLVELLRDGRGSPAAAVERMTAEGPATFTGGRATALVASDYATRLTRPLTPAASPADCGAPATWLIVDSGNRDIRPDRPQMEDAACHARYIRRAFFPTALWSGRAWTLYRHEP